MKRSESEKRANEQGAQEKTTRSEHREYASTLAKWLTLITPVDNTDVAPYDGSFEQSEKDFKKFKPFIEEIFDFVHAGNSHPAGKRGHKKFQDIIRVIKHRETKAYRYGATMLGQFYRTSANPKKDVTENTSQVTTVEKTAPHNLPDRLWPHVLSFLAHPSVVTLFRRGSYVCQTRMWSIRHVGAEKRS